MRDLGHCEYDGSDNANLIVVTVRYHVTMWLYTFGPALGLMYKAT